jgi:N-acetylglutamate synthase-like GNAT family acetyltransferase
MATPEQPETYSLWSAEAADASRVAELVDAAYRHYVERIGMLPGPMTNDYADVIRNRQVTVAERQGAIVGIIVLTVTDEGFLVDNVAVHPSHLGQGLGEPSSSSPKPRRNAPGSTPSTSTPTRR